MFESTFESAGFSPEPMSAESLVEAVSAHLTAMFGLRACWFEPFPFDAQLPRIEPGRIVLPATEPGIAPWSCDAGVELPVRFSGLTVGRFVLIPASATVGVAFSPTERAEAIDMAEPVGAVIASSMLGRQLPSPAGRSCSNRPRP
jgi:hypothetical protein